MLELEEARRRRLCRICEKPMPVGGPGQPARSEFEYDRMVYPHALTFRFGDEFAHTACLPQEQK